MGSVAEQKDSLRKSILSQRTKIHKSVWEQKCSRIIEYALESKEYRQARVVHTFVSMNQRFEVNTHALITHMLAHGKEVIVPKTDFENESLIHSKINSLSDLVQNKWGVLEPKNVNPVLIDSIELVFVPLLAVDLEGNRLGYGKGFYDRFLKSITARSLGLIFEEFVLESVPFDTFDQKLDGFISEKGITYT
ncbi:MAG: 5-formyltetrahydrofolate cyclo-ligase [Balneola sp.]|nr:MAG: 5-formyltetrahydrofolate cyclo-ligase [Balneola sp.]